MADLILSGIVGLDIKADEIKNTILETSEQELNIYLNSPGGDVFAGLEIYNLLRASGKKVKTILTGVAASMGSIIFLAGDERVAMAGSMYMVHKPSGFTGGTSDEFRIAAEQLDTAQVGAEDIYAERTGLKDITALLNKTTWFTTAEMKEFGITNSEDIPLISNLFNTEEKNENTEEFILTIEEMKAQLEETKAEKLKMQAKIDELEMKAELEKEQAELAEMQKKVEESDKKVEPKPEIVTNPVADVKPELEPDPDPEKIVTPVENKPETIAEIKPDVVASEAKAQVIDTTKAVASKTKTQIPAFMQMDSKY